MTLILEPYMKSIYALYCGINVGENELCTIQPRLFANNVKI